DMETSKLGTRSVDHGYDLHGDIRNGAGDLRDHSPLLSRMVCQPHFSGGRFNGCFGRLAGGSDAVTCRSFKGKHDVTARAGSEEYVEFGTRPPCQECARHGLLYHRPDTTWQHYVRRIRCGSRSSDKVIGEHT